MVKTEVTERCHRHTTVDKNSLVTHLLALCRFRTANSKKSKHNLIPTRLPTADASDLSDIELDHSANGAEPFSAGSRGNIYDTEIIETIVCSFCNCAVDLAQPSKAL